MSIVLKSSLGGSATLNAPSTVSDVAITFPSTSGTLVTTSSAFPSGGIIMWSGSIASIPSGWLLCDGTNSTPNLRDKFVVGAGSTYAVAATGGSADAIVVSHTHTATVTDPGHAHGIPAATGSAGSSYFAKGDNSIGTQSVNSASTGISVSNASAGASGTGANLPPYYALAYIMKS